jgi:hypothetical protein
MTTGADRLGYRHAGAALVRATTHPDRLDLPGWPDLVGDADADVARWCVWLARVWALEDVRDAVEIASPVLSQQLRQVCGGHRPPARDVRRMVTSMASYLLRWKGRATPFGLFAGVAVAQVGTEPVVRWRGCRRVVAGADADWLADVVSRLEGSPGLVERLPVVVNSAAFVRGDRLVVPGQPRDGGVGEFPPLEVSVRMTRPVRTAVDSARVPVRYGELVGKLAADFPTTSQERIAGMLTELLARRVLLTGLWPPMTVTDPLGHVLARLAATGADEMPAVAQVTRELRDIHHQLLRHNQATTSGARRRIRATLAERMRATSTAAPQPLTVEVGLDCDIVVPEPVIREAEAAASALVRLTPYPFGFPSWKQFHARFLERYGVGAVVAVRDLVQADTGLGMPAGYLGSPATPADRRLTEREGRRPPRRVPPRPRTYPDRTRPTHDRATPLRRGPNRGPRGDKALPAPVRTGPATV